MCKCRLTLCKLQKRPLKGHEEISPKIRPGKIVENILQLHSDIEVRKRLTLQSILFKNRTFQQKSLQTFKTLFTIPS